MERIENDSGSLYQNRRYRTVCATRPHLPTLRCVPEPRKGQAEVPFGTPCVNPGNIVAVMAKQPVMMALKTMYIIGS